MGQEDGLPSGDRFSATCPSMGQERRLIDGFRGGRERGGPPLCQQFDGVVVHVLGAMKPRRLQTGSYGCNQLFLGTRPSGRPSVKVYSNRCKEGG